MIRHNHLLQGLFWLSMFVPLRLPDSFSLCVCIGSCAFRV